MRFFVGLHQPSDARHFEQCCVSINRLRNRKSDFEVSDWIMDSGAFTEVSRHGGYREGVRAYAEQIGRWQTCGRMLAAVAQDFMCEPFILKRAGKTVAEHQRLTVERYDALLDAVPSGYVMPVLQGHLPEEYVRHVGFYGDRLRANAWVGVGSVCKRNGSPRETRLVLEAIHRERPDLDLHGFGLKLTAMRSFRVRHLLHSADSMAWSYAARLAGRNGNDWREARRYVEAVEKQEAKTREWLFA